MWLYSPFPMQPSMQPPVQNHAFATRQTPMWISYIDSHFAELYVYMHTEDI